MTWQGMGDLSPEFADAEAAFDPASQRSFLERTAGGLKALGGAVVGVFDPEQRKAAGRHFDANEQVSEYLETVSGEMNRRAGAFDGAIARIAAETGVTLDNPMAGGGSSRSYYRQAVIADMRAQGADNTEIARVIDNPVTFRPLAIAVFNRRLAELRQQHPGAASLDVDIDRDQADMGREAEEMAQDIATSDAGNPVMNAIAGFAGGMWGGRNTPEFWGGTAMGGAGIGRSMLMRTATAAGFGGVSSAALTAAGQPLIQGDRAGLGLRSGRDVAAENVRNSFLYGALGAGVVQGAGEAGGALFSAIARRRAVAGPGSVLDEALRGHDVAAAISDEVMHVPPGVSRDGGGVTLAEALDHAEAPGTAAPLSARPVPEGATDAVARAALREAGHADAVTVLRGHPDRIDSALASNDAGLRAAGVLADLDETSFGALRRGEISNEQALVIGLATDDPVMRAQLVTRLSGSGITDVAGIRALVTDEINAATAGRVAAARLGVVEDPTLLPRAEYEAGIAARRREIDPETFRAADRLEADIAAARQTLAGLDAKRAAINAPENAPGAGRIAELESALSAFTGKRAKAPRAQALRDEIARLRAEADGIRVQALDRAASDEVMLRMRITELGQDRARLGPMVAAAEARARAEADALGLGIRPEGVKPAPVAAAPEAIPAAKAAEAKNAPVATADPSAPADAAPASPQATQSPSRPQTVRDMVPVSFDDGRTVEMIARSDIALVGQRQRAVADLVKACRF